MTCRGLPWRQRRFRAVVGALVGGWLVAAAGGCTSDPPPADAPPDATDERGDVSVEGATPDATDGGTDAKSADTSADGDDGDASNAVSTGDEDSSAGWDRDAASLDEEAGNGGDERIEEDAGDGAESGIDEDGGDGGADGPDGEPGDVDAGSDADAGPTSRCDDDVQNGSETDRDCGGSCAPCEVDKQCSVESDCATGFCCTGPYCTPSICALASKPPYWVQGITMSKPRQGHAAAARPLGAARGSILAIGGFNTPGSQLYLPDYDTFDSATGTWTVAALPVVAGAAASAATAPDGRIYLFQWSSPTWRFDGTWTMTLAQPTGCPSSAALGSNGLFYVVCEGGGTNGLFTYDPTSNLWSTVGPPKPTALVALPTGRTGPNMASLGSRVYVVGGTQQAGVFESFDVGTQVWSKHAPFIDRIAGPAVAGPDGRIYDVGGVARNGETGAVSAFSPSANRWAPVAPLMVARMGHTVVVGPDGRIYAMGGQTNFQTSGTVEMYGPVVSISPSSATAGATVSVTGNNFAANALVKVYLGTTTGTLLATGRTTASGVLSPSIVFSSPAQSTAGVVTVVDDKSRFPVTLAFKVN